MRPDLAPEAVEPPNAVDPRAAKPPRTSATSTTRASLAVRQGFLASLPGLLETGLLPVTTAPSFPGFPAGRATSTYFLTLTHSGARITVRRQLSSAGGARPGARP